jgi:hypothetical protein
VLPSSFSVGAVHDSVARPLETVTTAIAKALSELLALPSLTEIVMFAYVPTSAGAGVPDSRPVLVLNVAQAGLFWTLNASVSPSASAAVGAKLYGLDAFTEGGAVPEIVGARLVEPVGGGCAVPEGGADSSSPPPQPLSAAALNAINKIPGANLRMTMTPVGGNPAILEVEFRRTGGFASPPLGGFAVE